MSEYWKSTPSYWCKFCSRYVRDSAIEKRNHEASVQHQNNIQRSLRNLYKNHEREERQKQQAIDEVARLKGEKPAPRPSAAAAPKTTTTNLTPAQQRKAHAEQLAALGVALPEDLKREVTGVGEFKVVSEREVSADQKSGAVTVSRSLADILAEERAGDIKVEEPHAETKKRKAVDIDEDDEDLNDPDAGAAPARRKAWGSSLKTYPGTSGKADESNVDLDALLNGVKATKAEPHVKAEEQGEEDPVIKREEGTEESMVKTAEPAADIKAETPSAAPVMFKKRKGKK